VEALDNELRIRVAASQVYPPEHEIPVLAMQVSLDPVDKPHRRGEALLRIRLVVGSSIQHQSPPASISPSSLATRRRASGYIVRKSMMSAQSCWTAPVRIPPPGTQSRGRTLGAFGMGGQLYTQGPGRRPHPCVARVRPPSTVGQSASYFASISPNIRATRRRASGYIVRKSMISDQSCPFWSRQRIRRDAIASRSAQGHSNTSHRPRR
jgi:hypothetical protein